MTPSTLAYPVAVLRLCKRYRYLRGCSPGEVDEFYAPRQVAISLLEVAERAVGRQLLWDEIGPPEWRAAIAYLQDEIAKLDDTERAKDPKWRWYPDGWRRGVSQEMTT